MDCKHYVAIREYDFFCDLSKNKCSGKCDKYIKKTCKDRNTCNSNWCDARCWIYVDYEKTQPIDSK